MISRVAWLVAALATGICSDSQAFVTPNAIFSQGRGFLSRAARHSRDVYQISTAPDLKELGLTPEFERLTEVFKSCPTHSDRQMELLRLVHMGGKFYPPLMTEENKVWGE